MCTAGDWLVCGGGPAASLWNLSTRIMSSRLPPDHGAVFASNLIEDQIYIAGQNPMLHMESGILRFYTYIIINLIFIFSIEIFL